MHRSTVLAAAASAVRESFATTPPPADQQALTTTLAAAEAALGATAFTAAWTHGRSLSHQAAIAYALDAETKRGP